MGVSSLSVVVLMIMIAMWVRVIVIMDVRMMCVRVSVPGGSVQHKFMGMTSCLCLWVSVL